MRQSVKRRRKSLPVLKISFKKRGLYCRRTINISNLKAPYPCGPNYLDVLQNTNVWEDLRKLRITGSRLPALLGSHGQERFIKYWKVVKQGLKESDVINTNFENFKRGHKFEK